MKKKNDLSCSQEEADIILRVARKLAPKFTFGYYDEDDIVQEAFQIACEALPRFDSSKASLESFIYTHLSNRLQNFKRDNYYRMMAVCNNCGDTHDTCEACERRHKLNNAKKQIMSPLNLEHVNYESEILPSCNMEIQEIRAIIDKALPVELRADYLRMLDQVRIPRNRKEQVESTIIEILENAIGQSTR